MSTILNFLRFFVAGWWQWLIYMFFAFICSLTVILLPLAKSFRQIAKLMVMPFGKDIIRNTDQGTYDKSFGLVFNIIWFPIGIILAIFYFISGIFLFLTIIGIPAGIVSVKLAKVIILPIGIKVVTKKEYIQEMVKSELKKQGVNNSSNKNESSQSIDNNYVVKTEENNEKNEKTVYVKNINEINADDVFKPFRVIFFMLFNIIYIIITYISIYYFSDYDENFYAFASSIFLIILIIQTVLYVITKFNLQKKIEILKIKYNYEILLFSISLVYVVLANIFVLIYSFDETSNIFSFLTSVIKYNILFLFYHYFLMMLSFKNFGGFEGLIEELNKYKEIEQIKDYATQIQDYIIKYNEKRIVGNSDIKDNQ